MYSELKYNLLNKEIPQDIIFEELFNKFNFQYFKIINDYKFNFFLGEFFLKKRLLIESLYFLNKSILNNNNDSYFLDRCNLYLSKIKINKFNFVIKNTNRLLLKETIENIIPFANKIFILDNKEIKLDIKYNNLSFYKINSKEEYFSFLFNQDKPLIVIDSGHSINRYTISKLISINYTENYSFLIKENSFNNSYFFIQDRDLVLINNNEKTLKTENFYIEKLYSEIDIILDMSSDLIKEAYNVEKVIHNALSIIPNGYKSFSLYYFLYNCIIYFLYKNDLIQAKKFIIKSIDIYNHDDVLYELFVQISLKENNYIFANEICDKYLKIKPKDIKFINLGCFSKEHLNYQKFEQDNNLIDGLSVCIIVKDEEKYISECINSVKEIADEIIVLDTGSTDNTVNIAKSEGAKVFFYNWDKNFSNAKNKAIEYAKYKWVFVLDSDEILLNKDIAKKEIIEYLKDPNIISLDITRIEKIDNSRMKLTRIFRKHKDIFYEGCIHEQVNHLLNKASNKYNMKIISSNIELIHYGYLPEVMERKKTNDRNLSILEEAIKKNTEPKENILYYKIKYLCNLIDLENNKLLDKLKIEIIENFTKEIYSDYTEFKTIKDIDLFIPTVQYAEMSFARMIKFNKNHEALQFNRFFVKYFPNTVTINYNQSLALYKNYQFFEALLYAKKAFYLHITDYSDKSSLYNDEIGEKHCPYIIALIYEVLEFYELSYYWFDLILRKFPDFKIAIEGLKRVENKKNKNNLLSVGILCGKDFKITEKNILNLKDYSEEFILFDKYLMLENSLLAKKYNIKYFQCISYDKVQILLNFNKIILIPENNLFENNVK